VWEEPPGEARGMELEDCLGVVDPNRGQYVRVIALCVTMMPCR
jgi:hypothetical protein